MPKRHLCRTFCLTCYLPIYHENCPMCGDSSTINPIYDPVTGAVTNGIPEPDNSESFGDGSCCESSTDGEFQDTEEVSPGEGSDGKRGVSTALSTGNSCSSNSEVSILLLGPPLAVTLVKEGGTNNEANVDAPLAGDMQDQFEHAGDPADTDSESDSLCFELEALEANVTLVTDYWTAEVLELGDEIGWQLVRHLLPEGIMKMFFPETENLEVILGLPMIDF